MKKIASIASALMLIATNTLYSQTINIVPGWQNLGALNDINVTKNFYNVCIDIVWKFDKNSKSWSAFSPNSSTQNLINNKDDIASLDNIAQGYGFWVKANDNCVLDINSSTTTDNNATSNTTLNSLLAGKTLYTTIDQDINGTLESWTFNESLSSVTWRGLVGEDYLDSGSISNMNGLSFTVTDSDSSYDLAILEQHTDYIIVSVNSGKEGNLRLYFDRKKAEAYFAVKENKVSFKTITIDGDISDWGNIQPNVSDPEGDAGIYSGLDIIAIYIAQDTNNIYLRIDRAGTNLPINYEYSNTWIYFNKTSDTNKSFAIEFFNDGSNNISPRLWDTSNSADYSGYTKLSSNLPMSGTTHIEVSIPKSLLTLENRYQIGFFTHYTDINHQWLDNVGEVEGNDVPIDF